MFNCSIAIFGRDCAEDEAPEKITSSQIFFVSRRAFGCRARNLLLLVVRKFQTKPVNYALSYCVLNDEYVARCGINAVAPEQVAGVYIQELSGHAETFASVYEPGGEHCAHVQLSPHIARVCLLSLILRYDGAWPNYQRAQAREFCNDCISEREFI